MARCDGTKVVLEPEGMRHITKKFVSQIFEPDVLSGLAGPPVDDVSVQQQLLNFSGIPSGQHTLPLSNQYRIIVDIPGLMAFADTPEIPSIVTTSSASMNETDGVNSFDAFDFGSFGPPSSLNQTEVSSSGQTHTLTDINQQFVSSNQGPDGFFSGSMFANGVPPRNRNGQSSCEPLELGTVLDDLLSPFSGHASTYTNVKWNVLPRVYSAPTPSYGLLPTANQSLPLGSKF
ncbi:hypothetical protein PISMIDRAFT_24624 [Pisolithus microcarpus 441]|uniref:Uncharacterized protein n=1 Tax=Pisolithus microcarpus 441 TaxID=765257 RepID=A0A0C9Z8E2_9AGAM|nr:hypothetical protein BKA83DRAFT_24624 [Pisolithus microcarpus]KIK18662.1 hypothetical protein PISMIDRAFT_24624 [Pisolithus microcarpus 441]